MTTAGPIDPELLRSLDTAGIGRAYAQASLADCPGGAAVKAWLQDDVYQDIAAGQGINVIGLRSYRTFMTAARALFIHNVAVHAISLRALLGVLGAGSAAAEETRERLRDCRVLFLTQFYNEGHVGAMRPYEIQAVEDYLTRHRFDMKLALCCQSTQLLQAATAGMWWSAEFLDRLALVNRDIVLSEDVT